MLRRGWGVRLYPMLLLGSLFLKGCEEKLLVLSREWKQFVVNVSLSDSWRE